MSDTLVTIIAIFLAAILMFVFPLMSVAERNDDVAQLAVQTSTNSFVDNARTTGKLRADDLDKFVNSLATTGNSYEIELEHKILDENIGKKSEWTNKEVIGENVYYSVYTSQIEDKLATSGVYLMKEGDTFGCTVKNTNKTISQMLRTFFYTSSGGTTYQVAAQHSGMVTGTGN